MHFFGPYAPLSPIMRVWVTSIFTSSKPLKCQTLEAQTLSRLLFLSVRLRA